MPSPPKPGTIIRYAYNWFADHEAGLDSSNRPHPSIVMAVAMIGTEGRTDILVLAITHAPPYAPDDAIEVPDDVKGEAGLDALPQWVVISESNVFTWPGPDLSPIPGRHPASCVYGVMPNRFLRTVALAFKARSRGISSREVRRGRSDA